MLPFVSTSRPARFVDHPINQVGGWYGWSPEFRNSLLKLQDVIPLLPAPDLIHLYEGKRYDLTYTVKTELVDRQLHEILFQSARALREMTPSDEVWLFSGLIDQDISSETVHYLFSYYQHCLGLISGRHDAAMYAPLGDLSDTGFPFPPHADLYLQKSLWVVFDNVPLDESGQTVLISTEDFMRALHQLETMPEGAKVHVTKLLTEEVDEDRFDDFFYFLYAKEAPWTEELAAVLAARQLMIKFQRGEGFLLNDRRWLHGRTTTSGAVREDRLHRLTFTTTEV